MKTKTTHTPGPWKDEAGRVWADHEGGSQSIALVSMTSGIHDGLAEYERRDANARLIAAAPEIYQALLWAHDGFIRALGDCGLTKKEIDGHATIVAWKHRED